MSIPLKATISIKKLITNAKRVKRLIGKTKLCAVVKADAYGHGLVEVSNALYPFVDCYAVSLESECVALRLAGIDKEIILLTPAVTENVENLILKGVTLTVSSLIDLKLIYKYSLKTAKRVKIHLALNSGMNRLGFDTVNEVNKAITYIKNRKNKLLLVGGFSHLSMAENLQYSSAQLKIFNELVAPIKKYNKNAVIHLSASGGALLGNEFLFDMVRIGIMLYGYYPYKTDKIKLERVASLKAQVILNRKGVKNKPIMYGDNKCSVNEISVIRLGYADGIRRSGTYGVIGNACMDICAVNKVNKKFYTVFNDVTKISNKDNTIAYDTLVNILKRAERIYK